MRIHQLKDSTNTLDQHCYYVLNSLQHYDPTSEAPTRESPFPTGWLCFSAKQIALLVPKRTGQSLNKSTFISPSSLQSASHSYTIPNTPPELIFSLLLCANLVQRKHHAFLPAMLTTTMTSSGSSLTFNNADPSTPSNSILTASSLTQSMTFIATIIASPILNRLSPPMPAAVGKTAQTMADQLLVS